MCNFLVASEIEIPFASSVLKRSFIMIFILKVLLISSLLISNIVAQDFALNSEDPLLSTDDIFLADSPNDDSSLTSAEPKNLWDSDTTIDFSSASNQEDVFAKNIAIGESCHADDMSFSSVIGRFKARRGPGSIKDSCRAKDSDANQTPFEEQIPLLVPFPSPGAEPRRDICPEVAYGLREIPVCSSGNPLDESVEKDIGIVLLHATPCKSLRELWASTATMAQELMILIATHSFGARIIDTDYVSSLDRAYGCLKPQQTWCCQLVAYAVSLISR